MDEFIYTITLADGTVIDNLRINGNCFFTQTEVDVSIFEDNTDPVTFSRNDGWSEVHPHMTFEGQQEYPGGGYLLIFVDVPERDLLDQKTRSDIDYIAMMLDIELD